VRYIQASIWSGYYIHFNGALVRISQSMIKMHGINNIKYLEMDRFEQYCAAKT
jgi:hypothetical protein